MFSTHPEVELLENQLFQYYLMSNPQNFFLEIILDFYPIRFEKNVRRWIRLGIFEINQAFQN